MRGITIFAGACLLAIFAGGVAADAESAGAPPPEQTILYFAGFDLWQHGSFSHGGLLWSPGGLDREGFTFKALIGTGRYRYNSGALNNAEVEGDQIVGYAMPGWRVKRDKLDVTFFAGIDIEYHRLTPFDPGSSLHGTQVGARGGFELWHEPTGTTMLAAHAFASTVGPSYDARIAYGWRIADMFYAGPEVSGFRNGNDYEQFRIGAHVTGLKLQTLEWAGALGWASDSDDRDSLYGRLSLLYRQ